jgi:hypothetical protein
MRQRLLVLLDTRVDQVFLNEAFTVTRGTFVVTLARRNP